MYIQTRNAATHSVNLNRPPIVSPPIHIYYPLGSNGLLLSVTLPRILLLAVLRRPILGPQISLSLPVLRHDNVRCHDGIDNEALLVGFIVSG